MKVKMFIQVVVIMFPSFVLTQEVEDSVNDERYPVSITMNDGTVVEYDKIWFKNGANQVFCENVGTEPVKYRMRELTKAFVKDLNCDSCVPLQVNFWYAKRTWLARNGWKKYDDGHGYVIVILNNGENQILAQNFNNSPFGGWGDLLIYFMLIEGKYVPMPMVFNYQTKMDEILLAHFSDCEEIINQFVGQKKDNDWLNKVREIYMQKYYHELDL